MNNELLVYFILNTQCQLACKHCYASLWADRTRLDYDKAYESLKWLLDTHPGYSVLATLHGGEPFYYRDAESLTSLSNFIDKANALGDIQWEATTNLIYELTPEILAIFDKFVQRDGTKTISTSYDIGIRFQNSEQEALWRKNVNILLDRGFEVRPIMTCTTKLIETAPEVIAERFATEIPTRLFNVERVTEKGRAAENSLRPTNAAMKDWLYRLWLETEKRAVRVPLFEALEQACYGHFHGCRARHCMQTTFTINNTGTISTCPNAALETEIRTKDNRYEQEKHKCLIDWEQNRDSRCLACPFFNICNGDCCQLRWDETGCPGLQPIIRAMKEAIDNGASARQI